MDYITALIDDLRAAWAVFQDRRYLRHNPPDFGPTELPF